MLVVDDNATNRAILTEMLTNWQMQPHPVADAGAALTELHRAADAGQPYRLMLLDALMPQCDGFQLAGEIRRQSKLDGTLLMMLSSADCAADAARCRQLGIHTYLTKPISQSELFDAVASTVAAHPAASGPIVEPTSRTPAARLLSVLLVEDNPVNRDLAIALLNALGHRVHIAGDGHAALAAIAREKYDAVLMDVQMPALRGGMFGGANAPGRFHAVETGHLHVHEHGVVLFARDGCECGVTVTRDEGRPRGLPCRRDE